VQPRRRGLGLPCTAAHCPGLTADSRRLTPGSAGTAPGTPRHYLGDLTRAHRPPNGPSAGKPSSLQGLTAREARTSQPFLVPILLFLRPCCDPLVALDEALPRGFWPQSTYAFHALPSHAHRLKPPRHCLTAAAHMAGLEPRSAKRMRLRFTTAPPHVSLARGNPFGCVSAAGAPEQTREPAWFLTTHCARLSRSAERCASATLLVHTPSARALGIACTRSRAPMPHCKPIALLCLKAARRLHQGCRTTWCTPAGCHARLSNQRGSTGMPVQHPALTQAQSATRQCAHLRRACFPLWLGRPAWAGPPYRRLACSDAAECGPIYARRAQRRSSPTTGPGPPSRALPHTLDRHRPSDP
jgi:hypothetical protein